MSKDQREQLRRKLAQERQQAIQSWNAPTEALRQQTKTACETVVERRSWKSAEQVKQEYVDGEIADHELDDALERAMRTDDPTCEGVIVGLFANDPEVTVPTSRLFWDAVGVCIAILVLTVMIIVMFDGIPL